MLFAYPGALVNQDRQDQKQEKDEGKRIDNGVHGISL